MFLVVQLSTKRIADFNLKKYNVCRFRFGLSFGLDFCSFFGFGRFCICPSSFFFVEDSLSVFENSLSPSFIYFCGGFARFQRPRRRRFFGFRILTGNINLAIAFRRAERFRQNETSVKFVDNRILGEYLNLKYGECLNA